MSQNLISILGVSFFVTRYWRCPLRDIRMETLRSLFSEFCIWFEDHPNDENTEVWLLYSYRPLDSTKHSYLLLWTCSHFEHSNDEDIQALALFMRRLADSSKNRNCHLAMLDNSEKLVLELYDVVDEVVDHIKELGQEVSIEGSGSA